MSQTIGEVIRQARHEQQLTLEEVAGPVGITPGALSHIESGRRLPNAGNATRIAGVLGIPRETMLLLLDHEHAARRRHSADTDQGATLGAALNSSPSTERPWDSAPAPVFSEQPIEALFEPTRLPSAPTPRPTPQNLEPLRLARQEHVSGTDAMGSMRSAARWSEDTSERLLALEHLADSASAALRTLRGMLSDDDPLVRREARRLLAELDVRIPEE